MKGVTAKQQAYTKTQWNTSQVKSFLLISLKETTVASNATPARHLWYVNYFTPFPRNVSLGHLWSDHDVACGDQKPFSALFHS